MMPTGLTIMGPTLAVNWQQHLDWMNQMAMGIGELRQRLSALEESQAAETLRQAQGSPPSSLPDTGLPAGTSATSHERWHVGMREYAPSMCWRFVGENVVCILDRGHDYGVHEPALDNAPPTTPATSAVATQEDPALSQTGWECGHCGYMSNLLVDTNCFKCARERDSYSKPPPVPAMSTEGSEGRWLVEAAELAVRIIHNRVNDRGPCDTKSGCSCSEHLARELSELLRSHLNSLTQPHVQHEHDWRMSSEFYTNTRNGSVSVCRWCSAIYLLTSPGTEAGA